MQTVRAFVDREVKPTVREMEHANSYPEAWIEQTKRIGMYGLAVSERYGGSPLHAVDSTTGLVDGCRMIRSGQTAPSPRP